MPRNLKYLTKIRENIPSLPLKLLKFKGTKWEKLKSRIKTQVDFGQAIQNFNLKFSVMKERDDLRNLLFHSTKKQPVNEVKVDFRDQKIQNQKLIYFNKFLNNHKISKSDFRILKNFSDQPDKFQYLTNFGDLLYLNKLIKNKQVAKFYIRQVLNLELSNFKKHNKKFKNIDLFVKKLYSGKFSVFGLSQECFYSNSNRDLIDIAKRGNLFLNSKKIKKLPSFLRKGDLISFSLDSKRYRQNFLNHRLNYNCLSHIEIDVYSKKFILIKDENLTSRQDYQIASFQYLNPQRL